MFNYLCSILLISKLLCRHLPKCVAGQDALQGGVLQELQLRDEGHRGVEHAGQPEADVDLGEEAIDDDKPLEMLDLPTR